MPKSLRQGGDSADAWQEAGQVVAAGSRGALTVLLMDVAQVGDAAVSSPRGRDERGAWSNVVDNAPMQRSRRGVTDDRHPAAFTSTRAFEFNGDTDQRLLAPGASPVKPGFLAAEGGLIYLDDSTQSLASRSHQDRTQPMQYRPGI